MALKRKLAASKSPLMGNLMQFLRELMKDYKDEIQEILAEDRQLMAEIDFDLKRFEQQEREEATALQNVTQRTDRSTAPIPPELANQEEAVRQQTDRRSRVSQRVARPNQTNRTLASADKSSDKTHVESTEKSSTNDKTVEKPTETNENSSVPDPSKSLTTEQGPILENAKTPPSSSPTNEAQAQDVEMEQEPPVIQASPPRFTAPVLPPPSRNLPKSRLLRSRVMSTPIRNVPIDEVSFQLQEADISEIAQPEPETRKRRRRT